MSVEPFERVSRFLLHRIERLELWSLAVDLVIDRSPQAYNRDMSEQALAATQARCASHPEQTAVATCMRCGSYGCDSCVAENALLGMVCGACAERVGRDEPLAWERGEGSLLARFASTVWQVIRHPKRTFEHFPAGDVRRALAFVLAVRIAVVLLRAVGWAVNERRAPSAWLDWYNAGGSELLDLFVFFPLMAAVPYVAARVLGSKLRWATHLRGYAYVQAFDAVTAPFHLLGHKPPALVQVFVLFYSFSMYPVGLAAFARGRHQLSRWRARGVAGAWLVLTVVIVILMGAMFAMQGSQR